MSFLDSVVNRHFVNGPDSQLILRRPVGSKRSYLIRSKPDERRIKSFLKMFYIGHISITFLGYFLASAWSWDINHSWGLSSDHIPRTIIVTACVFAIVYGVPEFLLWKTFRSGMSSFTETLEESGSALPKVIWWPSAVALGALTILIAVAVLILLRPR